MTIQKIIKLFPLLFLMLVSNQNMAQERNAFEGEWLFNASLSDNTDKQVERALREMGEKVSRCWFGCEEDRFRGGPVEQELYDRISYDKSLKMELVEPEYRFTYDDGYIRPVYTDGRSQSVSLAGLDQVNDFSMAHWENNLLYVEARPRDGGFANETYQLQENGTQLRIEMYIQPRAFSVPIEIIRIFDKVIINSGQEQK